MEKLRKPNSHISEVLYHLITKGEASIKEFYWMSGFRTRISDLKLDYGLNLSKKSAESTSKHGNKSKYFVHVLDETESKKAISIYNEFTKKPRE